MAGNRTLKLSILADVDDLNKKLKAANADVETSADKISKWGKAAALAFAAVGAAAIKFGIDAAKAAAEDEAAQKKLADTIRATTSASEAQIASVEKYITKTSVAIGITDDELRPAFSRLVRSTKDTEEAQKLLNLAMDLSSATGRPLEAVTNALAKAYDGNYTALNKLGLGIDANLIKSRDFDGVTKNLAATFGQFAENEAETTAMKFERIKIATDEAKESIGAALLPIIQELSTFLLETFVPNLESFINGLTGNGSLTEASENATESAYKWGEQIKDVFETVIKFKDELIALTAVIAGVFVVSKITAAVTATIALIRTLITAYNLLKTSAIVAGVAATFALNPLLGVGAAAVAAGVLAAAMRIANSFDTSEDIGLSSLNAPATGPFAETIKKAGGTFGTPTTASTPTPKTIVAIPGVTTAIKSAQTASSIAAATFSAGTFRQAEAATSGDTYNINVTGALDKEAVARQIVTILNESSARGSGGASALQIA